ELAVPEVYREARRIPTGSRRIRLLGRPAVLAVDLGSLAVRLRWLGRLWLGPLAFGQRLGLGLDLLGDRLGHRARSRLDALALDLRERPLDRLLDLGVGLARELVLQQLLIADQPLLAHHAGDR